MGKEWLLVLNYFEKKYFCSKLDAIFKMMKMDFGSKFGALGIFPYRYLAVLKIPRN